MAKNLAIVFGVRELHEYFFSFNKLAIGTPKVVEGVGESLTYVDFAVRVGDLVNNLHSLLFLISPNFSLLHKLLKIIDAATYEYVQEIKSQLCCADCGERHPATLQFHHLDSQGKMFNVADAVRNGLSLDRIRREISKCIVLCANCHAIRHYRMRNKKRTSPGIAGEFEELDTLLTISPKEEDAYNA